MISVWWEKEGPEAASVSWMEGSDVGSLLFSHICCLFFSLWLLVLQEHPKMLRKDGCRPDSLSLQGVPEPVPRGLSNGFVMVSFNITFDGFRIQSMFMGQAFRG